MAYTVKDLKELIADLPDDMVVVLSSDQEGNSFSSMADYGLGHYEEYGREGDFTSYEDEDGEVPIAPEDATALLLWP